MVGCGAMGGALHKKWKDDYAITIIDPRYEGALNSITELDLNYVPDVIVIAVKPQVWASVIQPYAEGFTNSRIMWVSVAAGVSTQNLSQVIKCGQIIRAMPNLAASYGLGMTGLYGEFGKEEKINLLFKKCGKTLWLKDENQINALTAISGSGPAYLFAFVEYLALSAEKLGFKTEVAKILARQTVLGASEMLKYNAQEPEEMRAAVTSPGGTTQAALEVLMPLLETALEKATQAATKRAFELNKH